MQKSHVDIIMYLFCLNENHCGKKKKKKIVIVKNNIAIRIAGKVSRYIDASMNHATPNTKAVAQNRQRLRKRTAGWYARGRWIPPYAVFLKSTFDVNHRQHKQINIL